MDLPANFPSQADVITDDVKRFRALSPEDRMRVIRGLLNAGELMLSQSPKAAFMRDHMLEEKRLAREAIKEFIARHVGSAGSPRQ